jgi:spore maturation protein CgeB
MIEKGYDLKVVGDGWPKDINAMPRQGFVELNKTINQAKLTVGISHFIDVPGYTSNRLYQCMATGVPHIAWHSPKVAKIFKHGYTSVKSYDELDEKIELYLESNVRRGFAGNCQHGEIYNRHTIYHAWNRIEDILATI